MSLRDEIIELCNRRLEEEVKPDWLVEFKRLCEETPENDPFWYEDGPNTLSALLRQINDVIQQKRKLARNRNGHKPKEFI